MKFGDEELGSGNDDDDLSSTTIYFCEKGHKRNVGDLGSEENNAAAEAYEYAKTKPAKGDVRKHADSNYSGGLTHMMADFVIHTHKAIEAKSPVPLIEYAIDGYNDEEKAGVLAEYLDENEGVKENLVGLMISDKNIRNSLIKRMVRGDKTRSLIKKMVEKVEDNEPEADSEENESEPAPADD